MLIYKHIAVFFCKIDKHERSTPSQLS